LSESDFLRPQARDEARRAIAAIERQTSAEVVVTVRRVSGRYREADYLAGFCLSLVTLLFLLFGPGDFALWTFPVDLALSFGVGAWISSRSAPLRRLLTPGHVRAAAVRAAAHVAFAEARLSRLPGRNAILVYLSLFEREAIVLTDLGIDTARLDSAWTQACARLRVALLRSDWERTLEALADLARPLATSYPRSADDENELSDTMEQE
jgi:putative membrane protein